MNERDQAIAEYPFLIPKDQMAGQLKTEAARAAKNMRILLKREYPRTRFNIHSETFVYGDGVEITWADLPSAPSERAVHACVQNFEGGWSDSEEPGESFRSAFGGVCSVS